MTAIEWADRTLNVTVGCTKVSEGCDHCYAATFTQRNLRPEHRGLATGGEWTGEIRLLPDRLEEPLRWRKPQRIFVDSLSDLFHPKITDEFIFDVLAVMVEAPQHTYLVLTKRPQRMAELFSDPKTPGRVARAVDRLRVRQEIRRMGEPQWRPVPGFPTYWVTDRGDVMLEGGSETCVWCEKPLAEKALARARFCSQTCNSKAHYEESQGRWESPVTFRRLRPDIGAQGHRRVTLTGRNGKERVLLHRLVLTTFRGPPESNDQGCHRDGDPSNNALPNLRWGSQKSNWVDRVRHGNGQSHSKLTAQEVEEIRGWRRAGLAAERVGERYGISGTQVRNIERGDQWAEVVGWPIKSLWVGTSVESDRYTFRADHLRATPVAHRFLSCEPLLGPLPSLDLTSIDWVIVGGESGPGARPMHPAWARDLRDRCVAAGVPFFFKQRGAWTWSQSGADHRPPDLWVCTDGRSGTEDEACADGGDWQGVWKVGKRAAGRELDNEIWDEVPA